MNPYHTLSIQSDATEQEIKNAYRDAAKKAHPDKGGSDEKMQQLNKAYSILSDPDKRDYYDKTGQEKTNQPSFDQKFIATMESLLFGAIESAPHENIMDVIRVQLSLNRNKVLDEVVTCKNQLKKLNRVRDKIKSKKENIFHQIIDRNTGQLNKNILIYENEIIFIDHCKEKLSDYIFSNK